MKKTKAARSKPVELPAFDPDAWERFERVVSMVTKAPVQHRPDKRTITSVGSGRQDSDSPVRSGHRVGESPDGTKG
jgi:hypothetical protein